jgi:hypothetical protein
MARSRRTPAMLVGRCSWELSDRKLQRKIKKSQTPSEAEGSAVPRTSPGSAEYYTQTKLSSRLPRRAVGPGRSAAVFFYFSRRFLSPHESVLDSSRSNSSNLILFGRTLIKAINKLPRQNANCSAHLDTRGWKWSSRPLKPSSALRIRPRLKRCASSRLSFAARL